MSEVYDVIVSGAGPVGLLLACELALSKCSVLVLEKAVSSQSPLKRLPFGIRGLSSFSVESLYRRGLLDELQIHKSLKNPHQNAGVGLRRQVGHFAGIPFHEGDIDLSQWKYRLPTSTTPSLISEMEELETILARRAESLKVKILRGAALTGFHQTETGIVAQSNESFFKSQWLVGCDGSRSVVRKVGGFDFEGTEPEFTGYTTQIEIADPEKLKPGRNVTDKGMYMQSQPGYVMMQAFDGGAFHNSRQPITLEHLQEVLRRISNTDVTISALHLATTWTDRARQATSYRQARVFLAGDAAHIHSPLGGQGLNLGLGDAMNLGWKLAAVIKQNASEILLDSYQTERHPVGVQVLNWSRAQVAIMKPDPAARALNSIIRDLANSRDGATYFASRVWGLLTKYDLGSEYHLVGQSVPNFEFTDGTQLGDLMHDGRGILLDFEMSASLKSLATEYAGQIKYISARANEQFGMTALLIRPDGIIAWACQTEAEAKSLIQSPSLWFLR